MRELGGNRKGGYRSTKDLHLLSFLLYTTRHYPETKDLHMTLKCTLQQTQVLVVAQNFKDTHFIFFFKSSLFIYMCARAHAIAHECYEDNLQALALFLPPQGS